METNILLTLVLFIITALIDVARSECSTANFSPSYELTEDESIGQTMFIWQYQGDQPWQVSQPSNSFLTGYFEKNVFRLNITGSTDLDSDTDCNVQSKVILTLSCGNLSMTLTVLLTPKNDNIPRIINTQGIPTSLREDHPVLEPVIEFGGRVQDADCPKQNLSFSIATSSIANQDKYLDGTDYFGINQNGTLFLKRNLDYETTICGVRSDARLYLDVIIKDDGSPRQQTATTLYFVVVDVDDAPPEFVDLSCDQKCVNCEQTSYDGNVTYQNKGDITVQPPMTAVDIENSTMSEIMYYIRSVEPDIYENMFSISQNDGSIILLESFQNVTNDTMRDDFNVQLYIQAVSNRTSLATKNVTIHLTVIVPPETTTMADTTTEEETTTVLEITTTDTITEQETTDTSETTEDTTTEFIAKAIITSNVIRTTREPTTPAQKESSSDKDKDEDYTVVIVVPVVVGVILFILIAVVYFRNKSGLSRKHQFNLDKNIENIQFNGVHLDKQEP